MKNSCLIIIIYLFVLADAGYCNPDKDLQININVSEAIGTFYNFWTTTVITGQNFFLDEKAVKTFQSKNPFTKYVNCVRMLGGRNDHRNEFFKGVRSNGGAICDFNDGIDYIRGILKAGYTPRIVLDNVPTALLPEGKTFNRYGNTEHSSDLIAWHSYVKQFVQTLVREFGYEQVRLWRFRVSTEPDLNPGHWTSTEEKWYQHYDWTVDAVVSVIPDADIGPGNILSPSGGSRMQGKWGMNILDHCATGRNYKTGGTGTPIKFFAFSYYGQVGDTSPDLGTSLMCLKQGITEIRDRMAKYPQYDNLPLEIHEFSILFDEEERVVTDDATEWGGSWMAAVTDIIYSNDIKKVFQWVATADGIPYPRTHVFSILEKMQDGKRLKVEGAVADIWQNVGVLAGSRDNGYDLMIYRHERQREDGQKINLKIQLENMEEQTGWKFTSGNIINRENDGYYRKFTTDVKTAGIESRPDAPEASINIPRPARKIFSENYDKYLAISTLNEISSLPELYTGDDNSLSFDVELDSHCVIYLRLER